MQTQSVVPVIYKQSMKIDFIGKRVITKTNGKKLVQYSPMATKNYVSLIEKRKDEVLAMAKECLIEFRNET